MEKAFTISSMLMNTRARTHTQLQTENNGHINLNLQSLHNENYSEFRQYHIDYLTCKVVFVIFLFSLGVNSFALNNFTLKIKVITFWYQLTGSSSKFSDVYMIFYICTLELTVPVNWQQLSVSKVFCDQKMYYFGGLAQFQQRKRDFVLEYVSVKLNLLWKLCMEY